MTPAAAQAAQWIMFILLGGMLGALGQVIRAIAGLKKAQEAGSGGSAGFSATFEWPVFLVSLVMGFAAGALACLTVTFPSEMNAQFLLTFIAAGYAGADFIDAFIKKQLPAGGAPRADEAAKVRATSLEADTAPALARARPTPPAEVAQVVIQVISEVRNVDPGTIAASDKLKDLGFDQVTQRELAFHIDDFFQHQLNMVLDTRTLPGETGACETVSDVIKLVVGKHPRPR
jgi:hypothetical protein